MGQPVSAAYLVAPIGALADASRRVLPIGMRRVAFRLLIALTIVSLAGPGCGSGTRTSASKTTNDAYQSGTPSLSPESPARFLPDNVLFAVAAGNPQALTEELHWLELVADYGPAAERLAAQVTDVAGVNLVDPGNWAHIGIDSRKALGVALFSTRRASGAFFATIADRPKLEAFVERIAPKMLGSVDARPMGPDARAFRFSEPRTTALLLREDAAYLVFADDAEEIEGLLARLAVGKGDTTLAGSGRLKRAFDGMHFGETIAGVIAFDSIARLATASDDSSDMDMQQRDHLRAEIDAMRKSGTDETTLREMERVLVDHEERFGRRARKQQAFVDAMTRVFAPLGTGGFGAELDGGSLLIRLHLSPDKGSLPAKLLAAPGQPLTMPRVLRDRPMIAMAARLDPRIAIEIFSLFTAADGDPLAELSRELDDEIGLNLQSALTLFAGEASFALTFDVDKLIDPGAAAGPESALGMQLILQLTDHASARHVLDNLATHASFPGKVVDHSSGKALELEFLGKPMVLELVGQTLVASTNLDDATRVARPGEPGLPWSDEEKQLVEDPQTLGMFSLDLPVLSWMAVGQMNMRHARIDVPASSAMPDSSQEQELARELGAVHKELEVLESKLHQQTARRIRDLANKAGRLTLTMRRSGSDLEVRGGQFSRYPHLGHLLREYLELIYPELALHRKLGDTVDPERIDQLRHRRWQLEDQMRVLRANPVKRP